jgi:type II secretory pathway pseudopilin PulG
MPPRKPAEAGYTLVAVMFLLFLFTLSLTIALPRMAKEIQRDRERETIRRGLQYQRAIQLYYRKFHAYPPNIEALVKTNNIRFLRKKYIDLTTNKDEWKPILFGQAKTQTLGFFGQPLAGTGSAGGSVLAGVGPMGGNANASGLSPTGTTDTSGTSNTTGSSTTDTSGNATGTTSTSSTSLGTGQTFGGAGIIGYSPRGTKQSILLWKKKNHYNEWEFVYDPLSDQKTMSNNAGNIGTSAASTSTPIGSPTNTTGTTTNSIGSSTGTTTQ